MRSRSARNHRPLVWALVPFCVENDALVSETWDDELTKSELADSFHALGLPWVWQPIVSSNLESVVGQISRAAAGRNGIVFNFCDGTDGDDAPGISVVEALERASVAFTGADSRFYRISTSKIAMKELFLSAGVPTPAFAVPPQSGPVTGIVKRLGAPLIVKPEISSASSGIDLASVVRTDEAIAARRDQMFTMGLSHMTAGANRVFVERFVDGDEFTVLLGGYQDRPGEIWHLPPAHRAFDESIPQHERFLSFDRYWGYYKEEAPPEGNRPFYRYESCPAEQSELLAALARRAYCAVHGAGYARVDIRRDRHTGEYFVLEVNANCGLSGSDQTSCGSILKMARLRFSDLLRRILNDAATRKSGLIAASA